MPDQYAIIGVAKLHTAGNVAGVISHMMRTRDTPNSNGAGIDVRIPPPSLDQIMERVAEYMPRKNAVIMFDFMTTASPLFYQNASPETIEAWKRDSLKWVQDTFGAENVLAAVFHDRDEKTPHGSYLILPAVKDEKGERLNARAYTGGREKLRALWTSYAKAMAKYGLKRGKMYSPAKHTAIKEYYSRVNRAERRAAAAKIRPEQLPAPTLGDRASPREYAAALINKAVAWYRKENAALREELAAEKGQKEQISRQVISDRELYSFLQENPETFRALEKELEAERLGRAADKERYIKLLAAVRTFFRKNIDRRSVYRKPENLGALLDIPELAQDVRISLTPDAKEPEGMEHTL